MRPNLNGKKILIVEDTDANIMFFKSAFKRTGAELFIATNGEESIDIVKENPDIDIILMDINMPKKDGLATTTAIKSTNPEIPIIIQTAYVLNHSQENCFAAGADFFIEKPIRLTVLFDAIQALLN